MKPDAGAKRLPLALAASVLMHACAVWALWAVPADLFRGGLAPNRLSRGQTLRPVQVALVAEPQPRRDPPPQRATTPEPRPSSSESAIARAEMRFVRQAPAPWAVLPRVPAVNPAPAVAKPPAPSTPAALQAPPSHVVIARQVGEVSPAALGNGASGGSGPAAGVAASIAGEGGGTGQGQGVPGSSGGDSNDSGKQDGSQGGGPGGSGTGPALQAGTAVEIVSLPTPEYPPRSRRLGEEGLVLLEVEVLPDGGAGKVRVLQAPDFPRLVTAAIETVQKAKFKPATAGGRPIRAVVEVPIRFRLD